MSTLCKSGASVLIQKLIFVCLLFFAGMQASLAQADFAIQGASISPTSLAAGNNFTATSTIYNLGNLAASPSTIGYYLSTNNTLDASDTFIGSSSGSTLSASGSYSSSSYRSTSLTIPSNTSPGSYFLLFVADYLNAVTESNETNNVSSVSISVVPAAVDFALSNVYLYTSSAVPGASVSIYGYINNLGNIASTSSNVGFYLSSNATFDAADTFIGSASGYGISPGSSYYFSNSLSIPASTTPGSYYILSVADYLNTVAESNETNNTFANTVTVIAPTVDLTISSAQVYGSPAAPGGTISTEAYIYNQGNTSASSSNIGYYLSSNNTLDAADAFIGSSSGGSLSAGSSSYRYPSLTIPANTEPGTYYVLFVADYLNGVTETNENNNMRSVAITVVAPYVDLIMQYPYVSPTSVVAGNYISVESQIRNQGNISASSSNVGYYLSTNSTFDAADVFIGSTSGNTLSAGNYNYRYTTLTIPSNTASGTYYVLFVADYLNTVSESVETNNVASVAISVTTPSIDLTLRDAYVSTTTVSAGNPVSTSVTIYNQGNATALSSNVGFYLSSNNTLDASDNLIGFSNGSSLTASNSSYRSTSLTIPANTTPGSYYIIFVADYLNSVSESNENNNTISTALTVTAQGTSFLVPSSGSTSFTTCTGSLYDNGGTGYYTNNSNGAITLNPGVSGNKIKLTFTEFYTEYGYDYLYIYDGTTTSAPLIGQYSGTTSPGTVYATNSSGALTIRFYSGSYGTTTGFEATIACVTTVPLPDLIIQTPTATPTSITAGNQISFTSYIHNQGTNASSSNIGYYLSKDATFDASSDTFLGYSYGSYLGAGVSSYRYGALDIPVNTTAGSYYLLFVADYNSLVTEDNETNNVGSVALTITAPEIDLVMLSGFASTNTLIPGSTFTLTSFIANAGSSNSPTSNVGFYLSANSTFESTDTFLGSTNGGTLTPGNSVQRNANLTLPAATTAGSYYIIFVADHTNSVAETNEENNIRTSAVTVSSSNYIDLEISAKTLASTSALVGGTVNATATVQNKGNVAAPRSATGFYLSANTTLDANDVLLTSVQTTSTLAVNATEQVSATLTIPASTEPGSYYILFKTDYENHIAESNESNGYTYLALSVNAVAADLVVQSPAVSKTPVVAGTTLTATATVKNQGTVAASSSTVDYFLSTNNTYDIADIALSSSTGSSLAAGATASKTATLTIPAGTAAGSYYILFIADHANKVEESSETNNLTAVAITVQAPTIDLVIQSPALSATSVIRGTTVTATGAIKNNGTVAATSSKVGYYLSANNSFQSTDVLLSSSAGASLAAGATASKTATLTIPAETAAGNYYILFVADPDNAVTESNEGNNVAAVAVAVTVPATDVDLVIVSPAATPTTIVSGSTTAVTSSVKNNGAAAAIASSVSYYLSPNSTFESSDIALGEATGGSLAAGASASRSATLTIPAGTAAGDYFILFYADADNAVSETNETNNVSAVAVTVTAPTIDLVVLSPAVSPTSVVSGAAVTATSSIRNTGTTTAPASVVGYYLSTDNLFQETDVALGSSAGGNLAAGATAAKTASLTIPLHTAAGSYYILFVADPAQAVSESNEGNNVSSVALTVTAPPRADLAADYPTDANTSFIKGESYDTKATLTNKGEAASTNSAIGFYLSADNALDSEDTFLGATTEASLAAAATATLSAQLTIPTTTAAGTYRLLAVADYENKIPESKEDNNVTALTISVLEPVKDLNLLSAAVNPTSAKAGESVAATVTIRNSGNVAALSSNVSYYLSANNSFQSTDVLLGSSAGGTLGKAETAAKTATLTIPAGTAAGTYFILFVADPANLVTESNETNNLSAVAFTVVAPPQPDLVIQTPALSRSSATSGDTLRVTNSIRNSGTASASASTVGYYLSANNTFESTDIALGNATGGTLAAGASASKSATLTIPAGTAAGSYYILFVADHNSAVDESNEINNVASMALTITAPVPAQPDLVVQKPAVVPDSIVSGATGTATSTIRNSGSASAASSKIGYFLSTNNTFESTDVNLGTSTVGLLAAGATASTSHTFTIPAGTTPGSYYILFVTDFDKVITESNETNNVAAVAFIVTAPMPDLDLQHYKLSAGSVVPGGEFTVSGLVKNIGTGDAPATKVSYYLSLNAKFESSDLLLAESNVKKLTPGESIVLDISLSIPASTQIGDYYVLVIVDANNSLTEKLKINNSGVWGLYVGTTTSADELLTESKVSIWPNPTPDILYIEAKNLGKGEKIAEVTLYNTAGERLLVKQVPLVNSSLRTSLDLKQLSKGLYFVHIQAGDSRSVQKVVLQK